MTLAHQDPGGVHPVTGEPYVPSRIPSTGPHHEPWLLTESEREVFRQRSRHSRAARTRALAGLAEPAHPVNVPALNPDDLMPPREPNGLSALSLFSGGGGLDLGFERAGFGHAGSWELVALAARTLSGNRPAWSVHGGESDGDVRGVDWRPFKGQVDVLHGGPPCQPFSNAGRQRGALDPRDMWPEFVRAVRQTRPPVFVAENVASLVSSRFTDYVAETIIAPLSTSYRIVPVILQAYDFGVPQTRRRVFFFGFRTKTLAARWNRPVPRYRRPGTQGDLPPSMGVREALGLPDTGFDDVSPTIRSSWTGPRHTTSVLSSTSAARSFRALGLWPNGVAASREAASAFPTQDGTFRMSVPDVALIQGFPESWTFAGAVYMQLGQIGNAVAPPVGYHVAVSVADVLAK